MPKAVIDLSEHTNKIINIVKARDGLRSKSEAIAAIVQNYEQEVLDPPMRPDFIQSLQKARVGKHIEIDDLDEPL